MTEHQLWTVQMAAENISVRYKLTVALFVYSRLGNTRCCGCAQGLRKMRHQRASSYWRCSLSWTQTRTRSSTHILRVPQVGWLLLSVQF